ncbi:MAG: DUF4124 domain-containing protein [Proteobacteria bacterium]|nr:DUF4124 domain-containing protein [Pseudomonadota bacterium]
MVTSAVCANAWAAPIYVWKDKSGATHFTNREPPKGIQAQVWTGKNVGFSVFKVSSRARGAANRRLFKNVYNDFIREASSTTGVPKTLVKAIIHAESAFNPHAVSPKGARGLMQIMPATGLELGLQDFFDPLENIQAGCRYLAFLLDKYDGNLALTLAAYNAGPGAVEEYNGVPPYAETRSYVRRVLDLKDRYDRDA